MYQQAFSPRWYRSPPKRRRFQTQFVTDNTAQFDPGSGQDIVVPPGFKVSVFKSGLNFPTGIAFRRAGAGFEVYVLELGHGLPSRCNDEDLPVVGGTFSPKNPFTPDILVFDQNGNKLRTLGKPTSLGVGFQTAGPAVDIAFENGLNGGRLFATDSNQSLRTAGNNNSSRIVTVDPNTGTGHAVHYRSANGRSPVGAAGVQGQLDLLVAGLDDQQRRRRSR